VGTSVNIFYLYYIFNSETVWVT